ncbi:hypothetical protein [Microvirga sp. CF3016]|uniref:hypothetical protein n=1 Tax=Microvirga sp. CF3016 TaxID=3110181 RepID=UPI002E7A4488|nr:hypothetical protein [Microvirga sp. CF3016]MEE1609721.1 hypothetical protein [Microvirga sp. CF3016]
MIPRQPPESPDDDEQSELLQAVNAALNEITPINDPAEVQPVTETQQAKPSDETEVEIDRIEAYLRGPTAFTA